MGRIILTFQVRSEHGWNRDLYKVPQPGDVGAEGYPALHLCLQIWLPDPSGPAGLQAVPESLLAPVLVGQGLNTRLAFLDSQPRRRRRPLLEIPWRSEPSS